jgi:hypothetical protein
MATGTSSFVGGTSVEGKITDANTGDVLAQIVDRRVGRKSLKGSTNAWNHVEQAFVFWAEQLHQKLRELRTGK